MGHRGPDGVGFWSLPQSNALYLKSFSLPETEKYFAQASGSVDAFAVFGHLRLSILDLSMNSAQPFESNGNWMIFNGEVYNYLEVREELEQSGERFKTTCDTEVILKAYVRWGKACFSKFNGMWAIAIWDSQQKKLILSRDRLGVKPLYYVVIDGTLFFASEIKSLLSLKKAFGQSIQWNVYRLYQFLAHTLQHHAEETLYEGVYCLRPGHVAELAPRHFDSAQVVRQNSHALWSFPAEKDCFNETDLSFEEAAAQLKELLMSSVGLRMRSDVPVGSALSGGIDSSAIVSILAQLNPFKQKTFSAVFEGFAIDESRYARLVTEKKDIETVWVKPNADDLLMNVERLVHHHDGPTWSTSMYAQWDVFKAARHHSVPVMLDGQGSDEIFGGYEGFLKAYLQSLAQAGEARQLPMEFLRFVKNHPRYYFSLHRMKKKFFGGLDWLACFSKNAQEEIQVRTSEIAENGDAFLLGGPFPKYRDAFKESLYRTTTMSSLPALLAFEDRNSMAFSVESRTPFLDYRIVELAYRCPSSFHIRKGMRKALLREALKGVIPEPIRLRKDKIGFETPERHWSQTKIKTLKDKAFQECNPSVFNANQLAQAFETAAQWRILTILITNKVFNL